MVYIHPGRFYRLAFKRNKAFLVAYCELIKSVAYGLRCDPLRCKKTGTKVSAFSLSLSNQDKIWNSHMKPWSGCQWCCRLSEICQTLGQNFIRANRSFLDVANGISNRFDTKKLQATACRDFGVSRIYTTHTSSAGASVISRLTWTGQTWRTGVCAVWRETE